MSKYSQKGGPNMKKMVFFTLPMTLILAIAFIISAYSVVSFNLFGYSVYISVFIFPLTFFISNLVNKLYGYKTALKCFLCAFIALLLVFSMDLFFFKHLTTSFIISEILTISIPQIINIYCYKSLVDKNKCTFSSIFVLMLLMNIMDNFVFLSLTALMAGYNIEFISVIISTTIKCVYCLPLAFIDSRIHQKP